MFKKKKSYEKDIKSLLIFSLLTVILISVCLCSVGCNDVGYYSKTVSIQSFRYMKWFSLPIKAIKYQHLPTSPILFKSKMSLSKIYKSINLNKNFEAVYSEEYILVKDISSLNLGYCLIYHCKNDKFNYAVSNMACYIKNPNNQYSYLEVLVPIHFIPSLMESQILTENQEYNFKSTKNELIGFYQENGYAVTETNNKIIVKDLIGKFHKEQDELGAIIDVSDFDSIVEVFEIVLNETTLSFRLL